MAALVLTGSNQSVSREARRLIREGCPEEDLLFVFRNGTLCFNPIPLKDWASVSLRENDREFRYTKFVEFKGLNEEQTDGETLSN